jgi:pilus assembly protein CpaF
LTVIQPQSNIVSRDDIQRLYDRQRPSLRAQDQTAIIAQRIYQQLLGFGVIDEIREMNIDGVSGGVSGAGHDSVWVFYRGQSLHFSHLTFGSMEELKRVCQNIYKYNYPGQLSERNGYKVNQMADGSRVVVVRPPFAETWAFFVRKFDVPKATLEQLLTGEGSTFIIELLSFLVRGARVTAITGAQGSGKTTLLMALVAHIDPMYNIRVQEMSFELNLRMIYPNRNILSFRETDDISGQQGLDIQKKTDGTVNIIGEVASDPVAAWMIQAAQVASLFTLFTHHAQTFDDLVFALRNSLLKTGVFADEAVAEQQVTAVLHFNVHMNRTRDGKRYVERVTECVPLADQRTFMNRDIAVWRDGIYVPLEPLSVQMSMQMMERMNDNDRQRFLDFQQTYWLQEGVGCGESSES